MGFVPEIRFAPDSPLEGTGFEPSVPRQEKWSMPSSSDQTRVGRTLTLGGGAESSLEAETSNSRSRRKTSVLRPMISARTARIDDNLGRGTDGSNPLPSSAESAANFVFGREAWKDPRRRQGTIPTVSTSSGTDGSNPAPSSGESAANHLIGWFIHTVAVVLLVAI